MLLARCRSPLPLLPPPAVLVSAFSLPWVWRAPALSSTSIASLATRSHASRTTPKFSGTVGQGCALRRVGTRVSVPQRVEARGAPRARARASEAEAPPAAAAERAEVPVCSQPPCRAFDCAEAPGQCVSVCVCVCVRACFRACVRAHRPSPSPTSRHAPPSIAVWCGVRSVFAAPLDAHGPAACGGVLAPASPPARMSVF